MGRLALGREPVMLRSALPYAARSNSSRVIPLEPDELWDAITIKIRNNGLVESLKIASLPRAVGLYAELRRNQQRLGVLLERMNLEGGSFDRAIQDVPAIIAGVKLAALEADEPADAMSLSNPLDFLVSIQGRGFPFMAANWMRVDYTNVNGDVRSLPMVMTAQSSDLTALEFSAGAPLSAFQVAVGSTVTLTMVFDMQSGRSAVRAFERFVVV